MGSIEDFDLLVPYLSKYFTLIRIDSRTHGRSTLGASDLTYQRLEKDVIAVLNHLNISKTVLLGFTTGYPLKIGHFDGGRVLIICGDDDIFFLDMMLLS